MARPFLRRRLRGKTAARLRLQNDRSDGLPELLREAFAAIDGVLYPGAALYVAHPAGPLSVVLASAFLDGGWSLRQTLSGRVALL